MFERQLAANKELKPRCSASVSGLREPIFRPRLGRIGDPQISPTRLPFVAFQQFSNNLYWRTDSGFGSDTQAFHVQPNAGPGPETPCSDVKTTWSFYTFAGWQQTVGEDLQSVVQNPGFNNPVYPVDDYSLPKGSPGAGFVVFDPNQAGRSNAVIHPPAVPATFPTKLFNPATDY